MTGFRKPYQAAATVQVLEADIQFQETIYCALKELLVDDHGKTIGVHDDVTEVPVNSLKLLEDPSGNVATPAGYSPIAKGKAVIGGGAKNVAFFRKGAAVSGSAGAATSAPATTPAAPVTTSAPAPVEDLGTGPEGNPNLNSDGTPKNPAPAPAQNPAPAAPAPAENLEIDPEGNPNLNPDGTPKTPAPKPPEGEL